MEIVYTPRFDEERRRYDFRFACEHCAHWDEGEGACVHGFPTWSHRLSRYEQPTRPATIVFCKDFDLA